MKVRLPLGPSVKVSLPSVALARLPAVPAGKSAWQLAPATVQVWACAMQSRGGGGAQLATLACAALLAEAPAQVQPAQPAPQTVEVQGRREAPVSNALAPESSLGGVRLRNHAASTLGATLQNELGTANASFGPNVGLPLIGGQGGARVRDMAGGLGTHDASTLSADLA